MSTANKYKSEIQELYDDGQSHYAIAFKIKEWYTTIITEVQIEKLLGKPTHKCRTRLKMEKLKEQL